MLSEDFLDLLLFCTNKRLDIVTSQNTYFSNIESIWYASNRFSGFFTANVFRKRRMALLMLSMLSMRWLCASRSTLSISRSSATLRAAANCSILINTHPLSTYHYQNQLEIVYPNLVQVSMLLIILYQHVLICLPSITPFHRDGERVRLPSMSVQMLLVQKSTVISYFHSHAAWTL